MWRCDGVLLRDNKQTIIIILFVLVVDGVEPLDALRQPVRPLRRHDAGLLVGNTAKDVVGFRAKVEGSELHTLWPEIFTGYPETQQVCLGAASSSLQPRRSAAAQRVQGHNSVVLGEQRRLR